MSVDDPQDDIKQVVAALEGRAESAAFSRLMIDRDAAIKAFNNFGLHKSGFACGGKRAKGKCLCGLDRARRRLGLPVTFGVGP